MDNDSILLIGLIIQVALLVFFSFDQLVIMVLLWFIRVS